MLPDPHEPNRRDRATNERPSCGTDCALEEPPPTELCPMHNQKPVLKVLIADDHSLVLRGLVDVLGSYSDIRIVAECSNGEAAAKTIKALDPDIAVMDMAMPGLTGLEVITSVSPFVRTKFIFLTASATDQQIFLALAQGASGVLHKDGAFEEIIHCIREAAAGRQFLSHTVAEALARYSRSGASLKNSEERLTTREQEITLLVAKSLSNKQIARELNLSEGTVKIHLHKIFHKLQISNRTALAALVINQGGPLQGQNSVRS